MKMLHKNVPLLFLEIITKVILVNRYDFSFCGAQTWRAAGTASECTGMQGGIPFTGAKAREASDA